MDAVRELQRMVRRVPEGEVYRPNGGHDERRMGERTRPRLANCAFFQSNIIFRGEMRTLNLS